MQFQFQQPTMRIKTGKRTGLKRECPECGYRFSRSQKQWRVVLGRETKTNICPNCDTPLFYRRLRGDKQITIRTEDKILVDKLVETLNGHLQKLSEFDFDLGEATNKERLFAYDLIPWARSFLNGAEVDLGMTVDEFLLNWLEWILAQDWWSEHLTSLLMLKNSRSSLAWSYWESEAAKRGVETPKSTKMKVRLKELAAQL